LTATVDDLSRTVLLMRNAAPEQFMLFMDRFEIYADETVYAVTDAPNDEVIRMQGRALALRTLLRIFRECDKRSKNG
jgi:hypothetical protein